MTAELEVFPIGTRVRSLSSGAYGTVTAWSWAPYYHVVRLDEGVHVVKGSQDLERAHPAPNWHDNAVVLSPAFAP